MVELLNSVRDLTRQALGCVACFVSEEDYLNSSIRYSEQWESEEMLHAHIRSDLYRRLLAALELSKQEPEIGFYFCSQTKGFELIETVRGKAGVPAE